MILDCVDTKYKTKLLKFWPNNFSTKKMSNIQQNKELLEKGELLTPFERQVVALMKKTCESFTDKKVVARIVGGWVRDKLLGTNSDDIDFSIEGTDGITFANQIEKVVSQDEFPELVVMANPGQSAHIGSAKVYLTPEFYVDICGLRWDDYSTDSRIPVITVGTPEQDAIRRDVTVNSIFLNINTFKVEDFTNGIPDLENHLLRTPQPAKQSFLDDPLRILRIFRFGARYNFDLAEDIIPASANARSEYDVKVMAERAALEITKAFEGPGVYKYLKWIAEAGMFDSVFNPTRQFQIDPNEVVKRVEYSEKTLKHDKFIVLLAAVFQPLYDHPKVKDTMRKNQMVPAVEFAILRGMKLQVEDAATAYKLLNGAEKVKEISQNGLSRVSCGRFVMETGPLWPLVQHCIFDPKLVVFFIKDLKSYITKENLSESYMLKPLMRGNQLAAALGVKPGPQMGDLLKQMMDWQLENPTGTAEKYLNHLKQ